MNLLEQNDIVIPEEEVINSQNKPFIEANTKEVSLSHLEKDCVIPNFSKDNESTISHQEFIKTTLECAKSIFGGQTVSRPEVRISHIVKGRVPSAIGKPVKELKEEDKTIYYERMMFASEIPTISKNVNGNELNLVFGGVRAYNQENLYNKKTFEKFKFFIGFNNMVCCNMCVSSDGYAGDVRVSSVDELKNKIIELMGMYEIQAHLNALGTFPEYKITERQFAQLIGKCRLYNYLPKKEKQTLQPLLLNDGQIATVAKQYYEDEVFKRESNGELTLWNFYNLLTGANKSSYIDTFVERSVNAFEVAQMIQKSLKNKSANWYLN